MSRFSFFSGDAQILPVTALKCSRNLTPPTGKDFQALSQDDTFDPRRIAPARATALAVLALAVPGEQALAASQAREAYALIEPHFRICAGSLWYQMKAVVEAVRRTTPAGLPDSIPADILALIDNPHSNIESA